MQISFIIGSPKMGESFSATILDMIRSELQQKGSIDAASKVYNINRKRLDEAELEEVIAGDAIVLAFPLYVDGIPGHVVEQLHTLEKAIKKSGHTDIVFYGIINNGFIESIQNCNAARMLELFAKKTGIRMGQVLAIGSGEANRSMLSMNMALGQGPLKGMDKPFEIFVANIAAQKQGETLYMQPSYPGWFFRFYGNRMFWDTQARRNGLRRKDMKRKPNIS